MLDKNTKGKSKIIVQKVGNCRKCTILQRTHEENCRKCTVLQKMRIPIVLSKSLLSFSRIHSLLPFHLSALRIRIRNRVDCRNSSL